MAETKLYSKITCPNCGFSSKQKMPTTSCQFFWDCPECESIIKPKEGDCCVFCSYGDTPCPSIQQEKFCC